MESSWLHGHVSPSILDSPLLPPPLSLPVLARANIGSLIVANTLWSAGFLYYTYLTFLGYTGTVKQDPSDKEIFGSAVYNTLASKYLYLVLFGWRANPTPFLFLVGWLGREVYINFNFLKLLNFKMCTFLRGFNVLPIVVSYPPSLFYTALPSLDNTMGLLYVGLGVLFVYLFSLPLGYNYCLLFQSYHLWRTGGLH